MPTVIQGFEVLTKPADTQIESFPILITVPAAAPGNLRVVTFPTEFNAIAISLQIENQDAANAAATEYLNIFSLVSIGLMWLKMASVAHKKIEENRDFYKSKIDCASIFFTRILTRIDAYSGVKSNSDIIMNYNFESKWPILKKI